LDITKSQFVDEMTSSCLSANERRVIVRAALIDVLQELPAITTIAYTGDSSDSVDSFGLRLVELYGDSAGRIFGFIQERVRLASPLRIKAKMSASPKVVEYEQD
jgi:hypothetical protein